jgi:hypothetical protein
VVVQGGEGDWVGYAMGFSEWLYRYLIGEEMAGWDSAAFSPGLVQLVPSGSAVGESRAAMRSYVRPCSGRCPGRCRVPVLVRR